MGNHTTPGTLDYQFLDPTLHCNTLYIDTHRQTDRQTDRRTHLNHLLRCQLIYDAVDSFYSDSGLLLWFWVNSDVLIVAVYSANTVVNQMALHKTANVYNI